MTGQGYYCAANQHELCWGSQNTCTCDCHYWGHTQEELDAAIAMLRAMLAQPTPLVLG